MIRHMKYFEPYLSGATEGAALDIAVFCDVRVFEWLVEYVGAAAGSRPQPGAYVCVACVRARAGVCVCPCALGGRSDRAHAPLPHVVVCALVCMCVCLCVCVRACKCVFEREGDRVCGGWCAISCKCGFCACVREWVRVVRVGARVTVCSCGHGTQLGHLLPLPANAGAVRGVRGVLHR
jgi:hypothetical protein